MTRNDRAALKLALALARNESPARAQQIDSMLEDQPWEGVAQFAASCCQSRSLNLDPWQEPPCWGNSERADPDAKKLMIGQAESGFRAEFFLLRLCQRRHRVGMIFRDTSSQHLLHQLLCVRH